MNELHGIFLESAGHLVAILALVALLFSSSRIPLLKEALGRGRPEKKYLLLFTLFWSGVGMVASKISISTNFVAFFAGYHGGILAGYCVGAILGGWLGWKGASVFSVVLAAAAGLVGGKLSNARELSIWKLAVAATALGALGFHEPGFAVGEWAFADLLQHEPGHLLTLVITLFCSNFLFGHSLEYHQRLEERERSQSSDRVIAMVEDVSKILESGLTPESATNLIPRIRQTLGVAGAALFVDGRVVSFSGEKSLPDLNPPDAEQSLIELAGEYHQVYWLPLDDGQETLAHLALLSTPREPFPRWFDATAQALRDLVSGWLTRLRAEEQRADLEATRFRFLQAQIRPHFLFNTLNTVASLSRSDEVRDTVTDLSVLLRESFRHDGEAEDALVTLEQELDLARRYLRIEKQRFGDRLQVEFETPEPLPKLRLPAFTLQPLVENAVQHGVGPKESGGEVRVKVLEENGSTIVEVVDDGLGMSNARTEQVLTECGTASVGIGLGNVRQRLQAVFGESLNFSVQSEQDKGTRIRIEVS